MARGWNGVSGRAEIAAHADLDDQTTFSWCAWIRPDGLGEANGGRIWDKGSKRCLMAATARLRFQVDRATTGADTATVPNNTLTLGAVHFVAGTYDSTGGIDIYEAQRGEALASVDATPTDGAGAETADNTSALAIGNASGLDTRTFNGLIWGVRWWSGVKLTLEELQNAMLGALVRPDALKVWTRMVGLSPEPDFSGHGHTATIVTGTAPTDSPWESLALERGPRRVQVVQVAGGPPSTGTLTLAGVAPRWDLGLVVPTEVLP